MNIFTFIANEQAVAIQKAELIHSLVGSDRISRDIFARDLLNHMQSLFYTEQIAFFLPLMESKQYIDMNENVLLQQRSILNNIKLLLNQTSQESIETLIRVRSLLGHYNSNEQLFLFPLVRKQLTSETAAILGAFANQFYTELMNGRGISSAYEKSCHILPSTLAANSKNSLKILHQQGQYTSSMTY